MTRDEEVILMDQALSGNIKSRNAIIVSLLPLLRREAGRKCFGLQDDLVNIGVEQIILRFNTFKPELGFRASSYFVKVANTAMHNWLRNYRPLANLAFHPLDYKHCPVTEANKNELIQSTRSYLSRLPWRYRRVILMRYDRCLSLSECGQELGISKERVRQIQDEGQEVLKRIMQLSCERSVMSKKVNASMKPAPTVKKDAGMGTPVVSVKKGVREISVATKLPTGQESSKVPGKKATMGVGKK